MTATRLLSDCRTLKQWLHTKRRKWRGDTVKEVERRVTEEVRRAVLPLEPNLVKAFLFSLTSTTSTYFNTRYITSIEPDRLLLSRQGKGDKICVYRLRTPALSKARRRTLVPVSNLLGRSCHSNEESRHGVQMPVSHKITTHAAWEAPVMDIILQVDSGRIVRGYQNHGYLLFPLVCQRGTTVNARCRPKLFTTS